MALAIIIIVLLALFLKYGTGKKGGVHLKDCPRDSTCTCYSDEEKPK
jgi:hypothetical protein